MEIRIRLETLNKWEHIKGANSWIVTWKRLLTEATGLAFCVSVQSSSRRGQIKCSDPQWLRQRTLSDSSEKKNFVQRESRPDWESRAGALSGQGCTAGSPPVLITKWVKTSWLQRCKIDVQIFVLSCMAGNRYQIMWLATSAHGLS